MKVRETLWIVLCAVSTAIAVRTTLFAKPCPALGDLSPAVQGYIDRKMPSEYPSAHDLAQLRDRIAKLEAGIQAAQNLAAETEGLDAKRVKVEGLIQELNEAAQKSLDAGRKSELQWLKANVAAQCSGLILNSAKSSSLYLPPLPTDIFQPQKTPEAKGRH